MSPDSETMHLLRWRKSKDEQIGKEREGGGGSNEQRDKDREVSVEAKQNEKTAKGRNSKDLL